MIKVEDKFTMWIENNICYGKYNHNCKIDLEAAKKIIESRINLCEGKDYVVFVDVSELKEITLEARKYMASDKGTEGIKAGAFLVKNRVSQTIGNFFLLISRPKKPAKLFTDENEALKWLEQYKTNN